MEQRAQVTSVEAIEAFRSCLIVVPDQSAPNARRSHERGGAYPVLAGDRTSAVHWEKEIN